jgi:hypothetical protein
LAEATAELIPKLYAVLNEANDEIDRGERVVREGLVQFVGDVKPTAAAVASSDPGIRWTLGTWNDAGLVPGTKFRLWETAARCDILGEMPGRHSSDNRITLQPSQDSMTITARWSVRSEYLIEPKIVTLSPGVRGAEFSVRPRNPSNKCQPAVEVPKSLDVSVSNAGNGWAVAVKASELPQQTLQTIRLHMRDETIELPVVVNHGDELAQGVAR